MGKSKIPDPEIDDGRPRGGRSQIGEVEGWLSLAFTFAFLYMLAIPPLTPKFGIGLIAGTLGVAMLLGLDGVRFARGRAGAPPSYP